jgi:type II secretory pathway pseudopilin PulG
MRRRSAFTLFQLLNVLAILAFGFALFMPAIAKVRAQARVMEALNNMKQMSLALHAHNDANNMLPAGVDDNHFSASAKLLPYIE